MIKDTSIESRLTFINDEMSWFAEYLESRLKQELINKGINVTGDLLRSISGKAIAAGDSDEGSAAFSFNTYGRFIDMGAARGWHKGQPTQELITNKLSKSLKSPKKMKQYSPVAYGSLDRLAYNLATNYSESIKLGIKETLEGK